MPFDLLEYYTMLNEKNVNIVYSGPIWADGVEGIGETLRKRLALDDLPLTATQSVFSVFIEQMNTMCLYSADKEHAETSAEKQFNVSTGVFLLGIQGKSYFLQSGNLMNNKNVNFIKGKIDYLNTLDKIQLRKFYLEQMKEENKNPDGKEAGIGLIEIARRASSKIEYHFTPMQEGYTFFAMYVQIGE